MDAAVRVNVRKMGQTDRQTLDHCITLTAVVETASVTDYNACTNCYAANTSVNIHVSQPNCHDGGSVMLS